MFNKYNNNKTCRCIRFIVDINIEAEKVVCVVQVTCREDSSTQQYTAYMHKAVFGTGRFLIAS